LVENRNYHCEINHYYTKQSWNLSGPIVHNCGDQLQNSNIETLDRFQSKVLRIITAHRGMCRMRW